MNNNAYQSKTIAADTMAELEYKVKGYDIKGWFITKKDKPFRKDGLFCLNMHKRKGLKK